MPEISVSVFTDWLTQHCQTETLAVEQCSAPVAFLFTASGTAFVENYKVYFDFPGKCIYNGIYKSLW